MKLLAILDSDLTYASRFMEYINKSKYNLFDTAVFSSVDSLRECTNNQKVDILILGEGISPEDVVGDNIKYIFCLSDYKDVDKQDEYNFIYMYKSAGEVLSDIMSIYTKKENMDKTNTKTGRISFTTLFSPLPSISKLSFSWSLSLSIAAKKKVLFVPLDLLPVPALYNNDEVTQSLSDFTYYLKAAGSEVIDKMKSLLSYNGRLSYLSGIAHGLDLLSLDGGDIDRWMQELRDNTDYDVVIFYISAYIEAAVELINKCNKCIVITEDSYYERCIIKVWNKQMEYMGINTRQDKYQTVVLPYVKSDEKNIFQDLQDHKAWSIGSQYAGNYY